MVESRRRDPKRHGLVPVRRRNNPARRPSRWLLPLLVLGLAGCAEMAGPDDPAMSRELPRSTSMAMVDSPDHTLQQRHDAPALKTYETGFDVVQGEGQSFTLYYQDADTTDTVHPDWFLKVQIPQSAQFVDLNGQAVAKGDTVYVTIEVDPSRFLVRFGPHGSTFPGSGGTLAFKFDHADLDGKDAGDLRIWYQPKAGEGWTDQAAKVDVKGCQIWIDLRHFSNYAIAF
jgi:hypothetical protein